VVFTVASAEGEHIDRVFMAGLMFKIEIDEFEVVVLVAVGPIREEFVMGLDGEKEGSEKAEEKKRGLSRHVG